MNKLELGHVINRFASEERIAIIKSCSNYSRRYCFSCLTGETDKFECGARHGCGNLTPYIFQILACRKIV